MTLGLFLFHIRNRTIPVQVSIQGKIVAVVVAAAIACVASVSLRFSARSRTQFSRGQKAKNASNVRKTLRERLLRRLLLLWQHEWSGSLHKDFCSWAIVA